MEDFGQIFGRVRDYEKYKESYDKVGKYLRSGSPQALVDCARFFDQVFLSYLIGNNDFHLRNVSVFTEGNRPVLTPAYDITITQLIDPEPDDDTTLPVNGKKAKLRRGDWLEFGMRMGIAEKAVRTRLERFERAMPAIRDAARRCFLPADQQTALLEFASGRMARAMVSVPQVAPGAGAAIAAPWDVSSSDVPLKKGAENVFQKRADEGEAGAAGAAIDLPSRAHQKK